MATNLNPYLSFRDTATDALEFYRSVFGGEVTTTTFGEMSMPGVGEHEGGKVMHGQLVAANGFSLMASDAPDYMDVTTNGQLALFGDDEAELRGYWDGLADGGTVGVPLEAAPWGDIFGMVTDKHGVSWMVNISGSPS